MKDFNTDLEGYKFFTGREGYSGEYTYGIKIFVKIDRDFTEADKTLQWKVSDMLHDGLLRESIRLNPESEERAEVERAGIIGAFGGRTIFVEEIPNGYCSQYCCTHLPWFIVTTTKGRIKIGWRKSVINIDWKDSTIKKTADEMFPDYGGTKWETGIHAYGYEKAAEFLEVILR